MSMRILTGFVISLISLASIAQVDAERAEAIVSSKCFICHGLAGESSSRQYPKLSGQHTQYIAKQLDDFKSGRRAGDTMRAMVSDLTADDMVALGRFFESKSVEPAGSSDPALTKLGSQVFLDGHKDGKLPACSSCHGARGYGTPLLPRLAGQRPAYLENQLRSFTKRERTNDNAVMHDIAAQLSETEIVAVSAFLAGFD
jgi:cytochrome c553